MNNSVSKDDITTIVRLYESGKGINAICEMTGRSRTTVHRYLSKCGLHEPGVCKLVTAKASTLYRKDCADGRKEGIQPIAKNIYELPEVMKEAYIKKADEAVRKECNEYYNNLMGYEVSEKPKEPKIVEEDKSKCKKLSYTDITVHEDDILQKGYRLRNTEVLGMSLVIDGHNKKSISLRMFCKGFTFSVRCDNTRNVGYQIQALANLLCDLGDATYTLDQAFVGRPIRVILNESNNCIGFGHFMNDVFVYTEDFLKIDCV